MTETPSETRAPRAAAAALAGACAFAAAYLLVPAWGLRTLVYQPVRRAWMFAAGAPSPAMSYYGFVLWSALAFAAAALATWAYFARRAPSEPTLRTLGTSALSLTTLALAYHAWRLLTAVR